MSEINAPTHGANPPFNPIKIDPMLKESYDSSSNYILYAGRISFEKGLQQLLESWIDSDVKGLVLKVVGTGSSLESFKKQFFIICIKKTYFIDNTSL